MKLADLTVARHKEKQLARTVGSHLAHMIYLYAQEQWETDQNIRRSYHDFDDFWQYYSDYGWKEDNWIKKFSDMASSTLKQELKVA